MRNTIYGYPYLNHLIGLYTGYWWKRLFKINEVVHDQNQHQKEEINSLSVAIYLNNEFWKCIGCIILAVTYGKKI